MIPDAFYVTTYQYDRKAMRWVAQFTSTELENCQVIYPILDGRMTITGKSVICDVEEDLALAFMNQVDVIRVHRDKLAADSAKAAAEAPALDVPAPEPPAE